MALDKYGLELPLGSFNRTDPSSISAYTNSNLDYLQRQVNAGVLDIGAANSEASNLSAQARVLGQDIKNHLTQHGSAGGLTYKFGGSFDKVFTDPKHANFGQFATVLGSLAAVATGGAALAGAFAAPVAAGSAAGLASETAGTGVLAGGQLASFGVPTLSGGLASVAAPGSAITAAAAAPATLAASSSAFGSILSAAGHALVAAPSFLGGVISNAAKVVGPADKAAGGVLGAIGHVLGSASDGIGDLFSGAGGAGLGAWLASRLKPPTPGQAYAAGQGLPGQIANFFGDHHLPNISLPSMGSQDRQAPPTATQVVQAGISPWVIAALAGAALAVILASRKK